MTQTSRAVRIHAHGGPEQLVIDTVDVGEPGPGQVRIRHHAIGLNFIDVYQRTGLYNNPLPLHLKPQLLQSPSDQVLAACLVV